MDKRNAIQIITKSAKLYKERLEDQKLLFLYGIPSEVNKQLESKEKILTSIKAYEVAFHRYNFLHLIGIKVNSTTIKSAIHFYEKCLDNRLMEEEIMFAKDGSSVQKLEILENMMLIKQKAMMIGEFVDKGPKLYSEKVAGNVCGCMGFIKDKNTELNVPNTLLKKDIRDAVNYPMHKVYAVFSKDYTEAKYAKVEKLDKSISLSECVFAEEIEQIINRERF